MEDAVAHQVLFSLWLVWIFNIPLALLFHLNFKKVWKESGRLLCP